MRSHLTRRVFRRIILEQPLVRHRALHVQARPCLCPQDARLTRAQNQRRTFFGLFQKKQGRDLREPLLDPGMEKMLELDKRLHLVARLTPALELVHAFRIFVQSKLKRTAAIEDFHVKQLLQTLRILEHPESVQQGNAQDTTRPGSKLNKEDLQTLFDALKTTPKSFYTKAHNELVKMAWEAWCERAKEEDSEIPDPATARRPLGYIKVLCGTGETALAKEEASKTQVFDDAADISNYWQPIIRGFAEEDNEQAMLEVLDLIKARGLDPQSNVTRPVAFFYARKDDVANTKKWFTSEMLSFGSHGRPADSYKVLLQFCLRNGEMPWGQELIESVPSDAGQDARTWNAIFLSSAATGKGVDAIDRMISIMVRRGAEKPNESPFDANIINGLIRYAVSKNDAYMAERYFSLLQKYSVPPNAQTFIAQIEYRLIAKDIDGALASYDSLRKLTIKDNEDWDIMNKLLRTVIARPETSHQVIMGLVDDCSDRRKILPADTVLDLCTYHLERDEYFYMVDLLQTYAPQFSIAQRIKIRDILVDYTVNPKTDTGRAWDTYMIFHQVFDQETHRDVRKKVMTSFFDRGRPDLATHVFTRMSEHIRPDTHPDADSYTRAFVGISQTNEPEALEIIHNLLKLDVNIEPDTRMLNALMLAYTYCGQAGRGLDFWQQISTSSEGPNYNSLHIALRACQRSAFGFEEAERIWARLKSADIEITSRLFADYITCMTAQGKWDVVFDALKTCEKDIGREVDFHMLASAYNACRGVSLQERMKKELRDTFPKVWAQIEERGLKVDEYGIESIRRVDTSLEI